MIKIFMSLLLCAGTCIPLCLSGFEISGKLVDAESKAPLAGFTIVAEQLNCDATDETGMPFTPVETKTGIDGSFVLSLPDDTENDYCAIVKDENGSVCEGFSHISGGKDFSTIEIPKRNCELSGKILSSDNKELGGLEIELDIRLKKYTCSHYKPAAKTKSAHDGSFTFSDLAPVEYRARVKSANFAPAETSIKVGDDINYLELKLDKGIDIAGKLVDAENKALAGISVTTDKGQSAISEQDGSFIIRSASKETGSISVKSKEYTVDKAVPVNISSGTCKTIEIKAVKKGSLIVKFQFEDKSLSPPQRVLVKSVSKTQNSYSSATQYASVANAETEAIILPPGRHSIRLSGQNVPNDSFDVEIEEGKQTIRTLDCVRTCSMSGIVCDEEGKPISGTKIQLKKTGKEKSKSSYSIDHRHLFIQTADSSGKFEIKDLSPGDYKITFANDKYVKTTQKVTIKDTPMGETTVVLKKGLKISGMVLEADGKPASGLSVSLSEDRSGSDLDFYERTFKYSELNEDGSFCFDGLPDGKFDIMISSPGAFTGKETSMEDVRAGTEEILICLAKDIEINGIVLDESGELVTGASVTAEDSNSAYGTRRFRSRISNDESEDETKTDKDGLFKITLSSGKKYALTTTKEGYLPEETKLDLSKPGNSSEQSIKIVLKKGNDITVQVLSKENPSSVKGLSVLAEKSSDSTSSYFSSLDMGEDEDKRSLTDLNGMISLKSVPHGKVDILVRAPGEGQITLVKKTVNIGKGNPSDIKIELPPLGSLSGQLLDNDGAPSADAYITLVKIASHGFYASLKTKDDGSFKIPMIPSGKYFISWQENTAGSFSGMKNKQIEISPGANTNMILNSKKDAPDNDRQ